MKKYFSSVLAVLIAISLSAFTNKQSTPSKSQSFGTPLFWYEYDPVNDELGALLNPNPSQKESKEFILEENLTPCDDTHMSIDCVRGYENIQTSSQNPGAGVEQIKQTDQR